MSSLQCFFPGSFFLLTLACYFLCIMQMYPINHKMYSMKKYVTKGMLAIVVSTLSLISCKKEQSKDALQPQQDEAGMLAEAKQAVNEKTAAVAKFEKEYGSLMDSAAARTYSKTVLQVLEHPALFKSFIAAVKKTGLTANLSAATLNATLFAPTDAAFSKLPAPFNNAANISGITDPDMINQLHNIIMYHLLGTKKYRQQFAAGRSTAITLKPEENQNDHLVYLSNSFGLLVLNGRSLVLWSNLNASNGVIHIIDDVLMPPAESLSQVLMTYPEYSTLYSALIKAELFGLLTGPGSFTVFAPTNTAFSKLDAPFNNAANIDTISDPVQIESLAKILRYHISESRYFTWDLGHYNSIVTIAPEQNNRVTGLMGLNRGWVRGNKNIFFSKTTTANVFTCNGVMHAIDQVLKQ